jgi:shikimate dehydrogenase
MTRHAILLGLIGSNIMKSLSPALHEDALAAHGLSGHYHLMDTARGNGLRLDQLVQAAKAVGFSGFNVTFPYKQAIIPFLDEVSRDAQQIGAVNTVTISESGRLTGYNTDRSGFARSVEEGLGRATIDGRRVVVVGAGGAGRAVAFALMDLGAEHVAIHDVDTQRATALTEDLITHCGPSRCSYAADVSKALTEANGVVNATPIGMLGMPGNPVPLSALRPDHFVADIIYTPLQTELIASARDIGCRTLSGGGMCVHQAAAAFQLFARLAPDIDRMARTFARALSARDAALAAVA